MRFKDALDKVKTLEGILPICSYCKKIRDDKGYWERIDAYISKRTNADFSHGLCPDCLRIHYPDVDTQ
jgi:sigma-B regulation protein RsbU (phosphoserine phosphatase)